MAALAIGACMVYQLQAPLRHTVWESIYLHMLLVGMQKYNVRYNMGHGALQLSTLHCTLLVMEIRRSFGSLRFPSGFKYRGRSGADYR